MKKPKPKKAGRPMLPPAERKRNVNTTLAPAAYAFAEALGEGSASRGLRKAVDLAMSKQPTIPG